MALFLQLRWRPCRRSSRWVDDDDDGDDGGDGSDDGSGVDDQNDDDYDDYNVLGDVVHGHPAGD